ncbi:MAG: ribonuclease HII, partial [Candidatus Uhrbacteria bacterium]|nr:ribonuclease HII [Candidatus Uhrbacteria bacterium]
KTKWWLGVRDSKTVPEKKRQELVEFIRENCLDFAIGSASHQEIDELNIHHASLLSMKRAVENLKIAPDIVLVDGRFEIPFDLPQGTIAQRAIVDGDAHVLSIAAASILAKVFRDDLMRKYDRDFPQYGFADHKGYNTGFHRKALTSLGPCEIHRMTFGPVKSIINRRSSIFSSPLAGEG